MTQTEILHMRISAEHMAWLDDLRRVEPDLPARSEMVRRLIERARKESESGVCQSGDRVRA